MEGRCKSIKMAWSDYSIRDEDVFQDFFFRVERLNLEKLGSS